ncbi:MAG: hypothetical protein A3C43_05685 [Candidatus Schekmanbacteria bacterium RIFCSPHIGHO2_02_FULL_38_11]|uniref:Bacterial sugar transferase domain-containing protein n=1 Tax=Candidatus Schekmanbacteria bacterium RIFCSPLOWO2_12_FULL_38_15 TaxID=1817883 RepID=A0A1F7SHH7_9BACT|nr:MAG: hypothetical protein A2043_11515 [Candidatus Schekmanbacteria bacterium GWA2_38_9]OGL49392.1 MAG: hypothetical protein A3H37_06860 [Candidatus Schekmanbacteria bacterium RIFCSPLOWO2_02_FULL_38_14]OGL52617.1 MAG: hypothetical protein A3G31_11680 [Candidatus Schekmanbacteria bacterium RIFCSPLOWO2_12_FULL_38_15]OGL55522.1 MAG: hypothetical protein A3C43_05685 [Candidatus Schekmanbacteria bacterium RIFCSPHIGHO2_02_FULL_38_11]
MLKQENWLISRTLQLFDLIVIIASFFVSYYLRNFLLNRVSGEILPLGAYLWIIIIILPVWIALLKNQKIFGSFHIESPYIFSKKILRISFLGILILGAIIFLFQKKYFSRTFIVSFVFLSSLSLFALKTIVHLVFSRLKSIGFNPRHIIIVGTGKESKALARIIENHKKWGLNILGFLKIKEEEEIEEKEMKILGSASDLLSILHKNVVDEVIFCVPKEWLPELEDKLALCEEEGVKTRLLADFYPRIIAKPEFEEFHGIHLLTFSTTPQMNSELLLKNIADRVLSSILLISLSPIFLIVSILIKLTNPGPVFFRQVRVGLAGRKFILYKFRSMIVGAEEKLPGILHLNERNGPVFKSKNDPRVTKTGRFLRATNTDELPQLINVLKGDMSLVGPRPPLPEEVEKYEGWQRRRLSMKPGMTCFWQISRKREMDFSQWMKLDLYYIDNWSLLTDLKIILWTISKIAFGIGIKQIK